LAAGVLATVPVVLVPRGRPGRLRAHRPDGVVVGGGMVARRGEDLMFVQSAGCCAGSVPMCFPVGEFVTGELNLLLG